jgi:hypothetical protein
MKKQNIIIISVVVVVIVIVCALLLGGKSINQSNNLNPQNQNIEKSTATSLSVGNWVSVAEKVDGNYDASMIMVCNDKDSCQASVSQGETRNPPSGDVPMGKESNKETRNPPSGDMPMPPNGDQNTKVENMKNKTMLSGTIGEVNADSIVLSLDTGEVVTILLSDSTIINKK